MFQFLITKFFKKTVFSVLFCLFAFAVVQEGCGNDYKPENNDENVDGFSADIEIKAASAHASEAQPGEGVGRSIDGDFETLYHSRWSGTQFPVTLTYRFENVEKMDYLIYYPRNSGSNGNFAVFDVLVSTAAKPEYQAIGRYDFGGVAAPSVVTFPETLERPLGVRLVVHSGTGGFASCAEMKFFAKNPSNLSDRNIFADDIFSELQPGVTEEMIQKMSNRFLRDIALSLFRNQYPKEFRVQSYRAFPNPDAKAAENKTGTYSLFDNPTGIIAQAGQEFVVFVGNTRGHNVSLRVVDFSTISTSGIGTSYPLMTGINRLNITGSGLTYVSYFSEDPNALPIDMHIASGEVNGYFDIEKHELADWRRRLNDAKETHFDVLGKYAHLVFPKNDFVNHTPDIGRLLEVYDSIVWLQNRHMGLYKYDRVNKNRMFFHVQYLSGWYMYATSYRTAYHARTMPELCDYRRLRTTSIWGPAHEAGHINQTRPGFRWAGMVEVSTNVFSMYVQTQFGNASRLMGTNNQGNTIYETATAGIISGRNPHATYSDVFGKLVPFWQLELYFAGVLGYTDFYADLYEKIRTSPNPPNDGECQLKFVEHSSLIAKTNLS